MRQRRVDAVSLRGSRQAVIARLDRAIHRSFAKFLRFMEEGPAPPTSGWRRRSFRADAPSKNGRTETVVHADFW